MRIAKEANLPFAENRININNCLVLPGLIDVHVHLRDQQQAQKEDFSSGTMAAVAGGITSLLDMPNNTPVTMDVDTLRDRVVAAQKAIVANVGFYCAFPQRLQEISRMVKSGAVAFKLYLTSQIGGLDTSDDDQLLDAFIEAHKQGVPIAIHAEDQGLILKTETAQRQSNCNNVSAYLQAHSPAAEVKAVRRILKIALLSRAQVHFCHISTGEAINLIQDAKRRGVNVSCEVTPHHLLISARELCRQGPLALTDPPARSQTIIAKLWEAVENSLVDIISSDHAPHLMTEKEEDSIWNVKPGIPGLETLLPLLLTKVNEQSLSLDKLVCLTAENPARLFHLPDQGSLKEGYYADMTVVDMKRSSTIDSGQFYSKGKYSPFHRWSVRGVPVKTFVNGHLMMDEGQIVGKPGFTRILPRTEIDVDG